MARLPIPYKDVNWGPVLNEYLLESHTTDGKLKGGSVGSAQIQDGAVTPAKLGKGPITLQASDGSSHVLEVVSADKDRVFLRVSPSQVSTSVPFIAPNLPRKIVASSTPPADPQDGDIWFDTSGSEQ